MPRPRRAKPFWEYSENSPNRVGPNKLIMSLIVSLLPVMVLAIAAPLYGACAGWLSVREARPLRFWAKHPWRVFWLSFPFVLFGALLLPSGFSIIGLTLIGLSGVFALLSAIHGLCVAWSESRRRAIVILCSVWILLIISAISEARHLDWNQPVQISKVVAGLLAVPLWVLAAWVDQYVSDRLGYRAKRQ